jgi:hypothetical protein
MLGSLKSMRKLGVAVMLMTMAFSLTLPFMQPAMAVNGDGATIFPLVICTSDGISTGQRTPPSGAPLTDINAFGHCPFCVTGNGPALAAREGGFLVDLGPMHLVSHPASRETGTRIISLDKPFPPRAPPCSV